MNYGKFPYEPYGYQGGYFNKNNHSLAASLGGLVGNLIRAVAGLVYYLSAGTIKLAIALGSKAWSGISAGWRAGFRTKE